MTLSLPTALDDFERMTDDLTAAVVGHPSLAGLVFFGSSSRDAASRRDEWSDHDFFAIAAPGAAAIARRDVLEWLPRRERLALIAHEGQIGFVAVYDDGHVLEFAVAEPEELAGALAEEATVAVDDDEESVGRLVRESKARTDEMPDPEAANETRLALVKLLIGTGRLRRGEIVNGGQFVRQWAVKHFVLALRARARDVAGSGHVGLEPTRRLEDAFPSVAADIEAAIAQPAELAAESLFALMRRVLEPEWDEFPSAAADTVARRLGW